MNFEQRTIKRKTNRLGKPAWRFQKCLFQIEKEEVSSKMDPTESRLHRTEVNLDITKPREKG